MESHAWLLSEMSVVVMKRMWILVWRLFLFGWMDTWIHVASVVLLHGMDNDNDAMMKWCKYVVVGKSIYESIYKK